MRYVYNCNGREVTLTDDDATKIRKVSNKMFFFIICDKCCNIKVLHILRRAD